MAWVLADMDDIASDMSAIHRIDDIDVLPTQRFWPLAERLAFYPGIVSAKFRYQHSAAPERREPPQVGAPTVTADNIDDILANPLYGDVPGLAAVFSHTTVPG